MARLETKLRGDREAHVSGLGVQAGEAQGRLVAGEAARTRGTDGAWALGMYRPQPG
jgi:hypothetical protein